MFGGEFGINSSFKEMETGFGLSSIQELNDLRKALSAGYQVSSQTGGGALRVQSLESSLKVVTFTQREFKFWQEVPKLPAYSTVEEYNVLSGYGAASGNQIFGFNTEGSLPYQADSTYARQTALVKFMGTTRQVSHPLTLVRPAHGDVIALENQNGILDILRGLEAAFFRGNSSLVFSGTGPEFDGLAVQISSNNLIDLAGTVLSEEVISEGANLVRQNYGTPTHMFLSTRAMTDFGKTIYGKERFLPQQAQVNAQGQVGYFIQSVITQAGPIGMRDDVFVTVTPQEPAAAFSTGAPTAPASITIGSPTGSDGAFASKDGAGTYSYSATFGNQYGESAPTAAQTVTLTSAQVAANNHVPLTITNASSIATVPQFVGIYRSQPNGSIRYEIARIPVASQSPSGTTTFNDTDAIMANTSEAYLGEMSTQAIAFKQLSPLMKMDLAIVAPAYRWMILLYGVLVLYAPAKWVRFINIGTSSAVTTI